jgi:D-alanine transaminase
MPNIAYVNGKWTALQSATISVEDRGFQFGDGVYEVMRTYDGQVFHLTAHVERLLESASLVQIRPRETPRQIQKIIESGCKKTGYKETKIYVQMTRGIAPRLHSFPKNNRPTSVYTFREMTPIPEKTRHQGVSVISVEDIRWGLCHVKSLNLLPNILAREQALQSGDYEALFVRNGRVWEGAGSNLFAVLDQQIVTPPKGPFLLSGITREQVIKLGQKMGMPLREAEVSLQDLYRADEVFLTGTTIEILPVVRVNGKKVGTGKPGKTTQRLFLAFEEETRSLSLHP